MNKFLKTRAEVDLCTQYINSKGMISHAFPCKNWDVALICQELKDGDLLDLGSNGSFLLQNALKMGIKGRKCGIDLGNPEYNVDSIEYIKGDLMATPYPDNSFDTITCLSVIEHEVNYQMLAKECSRLLKNGGKLYITFDYWNPKVDTAGLRLYNLAWNILDQKDAAYLIAEFLSYGIEITGQMDWSIQDTVINPQFYAPFGKAYTFGIISFIKK